MATGPAGSYYNLPITELRKTTGMFHDVDTNLPGESMQRVTPTTVME